MWQNAFCFFCFFRVTLSVDGIVAQTDGQTDNRPIRLTQFCTQFKSLGVKVLCVLHLHDNVAFTFK